MKRSVILEGLDIELILSKVVEIDTKLEMINFEKNERRVVETNLF